MRAFPTTLPMLLVLLAACGSVADRADCGASADCPAGQYCARTPGGNVCWPDAVPPTISSVSVRCASPCLRDGVLHVEAAVADDAEVLGADVTLDVGGPAVPMARGGPVWWADVPLRQFPFDHFAHGVVATVTARDGARNETTMDASAATTVTRLRFERALDTGVFSLGAPAVMHDGTVVTAGTNGKVYFVPWDGSGVSSVAVGTGQITAAPLVLGGSVWVGSEDNKVYEVTRSGAAWQPGPRCDTTRPVRGSLAATLSGFVLATSDVGRVFSASAAGCAGNSGRGASFSLGPVIDFDGSVYAAAGTSLRRLLLDAAGILDDDPSFIATTLAWPALEPLVANSALLVVTGLGPQGRIYRAAPSDSDPQQLAPTMAPSGGLVTLADGSMLLPEQTETISKWVATPIAQPVWRSPTLSGLPRTPIVVASAQPFVLSTDVGGIHVLRPDGTIAWSGQLSAGTASLQPGNIYTPPSEPAGAELSTAYFAGSDGVLHAVIVDGKLDGAAPWPKAFHDPRNTNRAGAQP